MDSMGISVIQVRSHCFIWTSVRMNPTFPDATDGRIVAIQRAGPRQLRQARLNWLEMFT